jgi:hypothetical protein
LTIREVVDHDWIIAQKIRDWSKDENTDALGIPFPRTCWCHNRGPFSADFSRQGWENHARLLFKAPSEGNQFGLTKSSIKLARLATKIVPNGSVINDPQAGGMRRLEDLITYIKELLVVRLQQHLKTARS